MAYIISFNQHQNEFYFVPSSFIQLERLIHSTKTAIACIIGFFITKIMGPPTDQWIVITIIVVMCAQIYVGSVIQKAYLRFLGTLAGCLFAASILLFAGDDNLAIMLAISISSFIFSYIAIGGENLVYAGTLGAATTAIIMLSRHPTLLLAFERFIEISIGILIAAVVSQFVLPIHARSHLRRSQADTLTQLREYYIELMMNRYMNKQKETPENLDENIVKSLIKQRQLAKESAREPLGLAFNPSRFAQTLYCERKILRSISFMHDALMQIKKVDTTFPTLTSVHHFNDCIIQSFNTFIHALGSETTGNHHIHMTSLLPLKDELVKMTDSPSQEDILHIDGFLFSAETLVASLVKLAHLFHIPVANQVSGSLTS